MGSYINTGNAGFQSARNGEYVDKSELISVVNDTLFTERRFSCVTRCRRFGKSMAAKMLCAYCQQFIFIIDEWDAICREFAPGTETMDRYVDWLRRMFKSADAVRMFAGVYLTGILPIKKYKTESALNNFQEYSMVEPRRMACHFGFTKDEVKRLAEKKAHLPHSEIFTMTGNHISL